MLHVKPGSQPPVQNLRPCDLCVFPGKLPSGRYQQSHTVVFDCWSQVHIRVLQSLDKMLSECRGYYISSHCVGSEIILLMSQVRQTVDKSSTFFCTSAANRGNRLAPGMQGTYASVTFPKMPGRYR